MIRYIGLLVFQLVIYISVSAQQGIKIIDKPVLYDSERVQLSLQYLGERHHIQQQTPVIKPVMIVLHWTATPDLKTTFDGFYPAVLRTGDRKDLAGYSRLNTSSQFLIDRDGTIYRLMPENYFARHVIGLNYCAIGVENVGSDNAPLTAAQLKSNEQLVRYLAAKYPIRYLIGHYEYTLFKGSPLWREADNNYHTAKDDPGEDFMRAIRGRVADLGLASRPW